jgi:glycerol-3-phosphate O-acyltransferase
MVNLSEKESVLMTYYRNNIIHLFAIPSFIAAQLRTHGPQSSQQVIEAVSQLYPLFKDEWFLRDLDLAAYCESIITTLIEQGLLTVENDQLHCADQQSSAYYKLELLANIIQTTLQRYTIVFNLITHSKQLRQQELENKSQAIGKRLSSKHGINSPEFLDKKVLANLIESLQKHQLVTLEQTDQLLSSEKLEVLTATVTSVLDNKIRQSITQVM